MNKKSLIEYFKIKHTKGGSSIDENSSFEEVFEKVTGKSYNNYLKKLEKIKKKEAKIEYEKKIPQRKLNLKKSNIKVIQGIFPEELNKQHMIIKCKPGKRITILNIWVTETQDSEFVIKLPEHVILAKYPNENIYACYSKKPPYDFEIEYVMRKAEQSSILKGEQSSMLKADRSDAESRSSIYTLPPAEQHTLNLKVNLMAKNLTPKLLELTPELKRKLT